MKNIRIFFKRGLLLLVFGITLVSCSNKSEQFEQGKFTKYVDPNIGKGDHGHVFVGANVPFGLVQLGPVNYSHGWDWCSGYHQSDSTIIGFSHLHLSGTGIGDLGDIALMPVVGDVKLIARGKVDDYSSNFLSLFRRNTETVRPGYYAVSLERYNIGVELSATERVGIHSYSFPESENAKVIFDLTQGIGWDAPVEGYITQEDETTISGYRYSKGWAKDQRVYFTAKFSKPMKNFQVSINDTIQEGKTLKNKQTLGVAQFDTKNGEKLLVKVAVSPVSIENAKMNMQAELNDWDFNKVVSNADKAWNKELGKVEVKGKSEKDLRVFYTALYHSMVAPSIFNDVNKDYWGTDKQVHKSADFNNYTTFSLWDTYRAAHPLMTIIHPEKMNDIVATMLNIYKEQGKLPVWHLMANETDCMVGNPGIAVVADAYLKGFQSKNPEFLFEALKNSALLDERELSYLKIQGYIPIDNDIVESVAKGLEYALADATIALVAKEMGKKEDYELFAKRAKAYEYYFDKGTNFMRGRATNGTWRTPFNPFDASHRTNDYTEGNAWQYTWLVPQDVEGLVSLFGSEDAFVKKLDSLFTISGDMGENASPDVSGLIGQYAHGNEPGHHILYLYNYVGQPWKSADLIRKTLNTMYTDQPAGLCGNEDVGQMSSWYVLSSLGFYQVAPAGGIYVFGSPLFDEASISVGEGKIFKIVANNNSSENKYIQSAKLNGEPYTKLYIDYKDIVKGGLLEFEMASTPSETWGANKDDRPYSKK